MTQLINHSSISLGVLSFSIAILGVAFSGGSLTLMYYYPVALFVILLAWMSLLKSKIRLSWQHGAIIILLLEIVWHLDTSVDHFESSKAIISLLLFLAMYFLLTLHKTTLREIRLTCSCFCWSGFIIAVLLLLFKQEYEMGRYSYPVGSRLVEVNYLACYLAISFVFFLHRIFTGQKLTKLLYIAAGFIILYALFLTGSRMGFLSVGLSAFILLLYNPKNLPLKIIFFLVIILFAFAILPPDLTDRFLHRSYNDGSNRTRLLLFQNALNFIFLKPIFGYGVASGRAITGLGSAHNTFLSVLLCLGMVGLGMFLTILFKNFKVLFQRDMFCFLSIWIVVIFCSMIISLYNAIPFWFSVILLYWVTEYKKENPTVSLWNSL